ncbi:hypothetical protein HNP46_000337 [Pseudomonas nitritireducens]|uniref:Uncharacterized protein n=1 Tax=Pseudomonas nitroreducens TaxID=46680 RepID=A0A7W7KFJ7_PSENT|nr:hypothetical protein [Pseudomonas nitritireducens]MBB4861526.1 hypothetical protein [Pseudomonas nitritireducens]
MARQASTIPTHTLTRPAPLPCSSMYLAGWEYGDWFIVKAGEEVNLYADAPDQWGDEKANGFYDRLAEERTSLH